MKKLLLLVLLISGANEIFLFNEFEVDAEEQVEGACMIGKTFRGAIDGVDFFLDALAAGTVA